MHASEIAYGPALDYPVRASSSIPSLSHSLTNRFASWFLITTILCVLTPSSSSPSSAGMMSTVLTCGALRLTVPPGAEKPSFTVRPSGAVDLSLSQFTGVLTFEALPASPQSLIPSISNDALPIHIPAFNLPYTPPASQKPDSFLPSSPAASVVPVISTAEPHFSDHTHGLALTPPSSQSQSQSDSDSDPNSDKSKSDYTFNPLPEFTESQPDATLSQKTPPPENPLSNTLDNLPEKRPIAPAVEYRASKNGKRVRFEENPVILQSPQNDPRPIALSSSPWQTMSIAGAPARRWGATFTTLNHARAVVLLGGESEAAGFFNTMAIYDAEKSVWLQRGNDTPDMPGNGRAWHTTVCVDVSLFVFGGERDVDGARTQTNDALMYDTTYYTWYPPALVGSPPSPRAGHCAAVVPGSRNVVIYGGINGNRWLNDLHLLQDLATWTKPRLSNKSSRPSARSYASLTAAKEFLVLFGGNNKTRCFNDVHILTPDMNWVEPVIMGRAPKPRTGHCAITSRDESNVIIYGGWDDQGKQRLFYSDVWLLDIKSQAECQWRCIYAGDNSSKTPGPRAGASLCSVGDEQQDMLLFGGWYQLSYFNDLTKLALPGDDAQKNQANK